MSDSYGVYLDDRVVGSVKVTRQGLYYRFQCSCRAEEEGRFFLYACCDGKEENLGLLIPTDGTFSLEKSIPIKKLGQGRLTFHICGKGEAQKKTGILLDPNEPFANIGLLRVSRLQILEGKYYILPMK